MSSLAFPACLSAGWTQSLRGVMCSQAEENAARENAAHAIPTRAEMSEMGFGEDEELTISLPVWSDDEDEDEERRSARSEQDKEEVVQRRVHETLELMKTVAPQHNHAERQLHADPLLLASPEPIDPAFAIAHVDVAEVSTERFHDEFVRPGRPAARSAHTR